MVNYRYQLLCTVTNPTVYNRSICKYNLIDVYKYNLIDACINVFLESLERKFMLAIFMHGKFGVTLLFLLLSSKSATLEGQADGQVD
jgi:hypothetical protein